MISPQKKGQTWTIDYTIGLVLFLLALAIVTDILMETFQEQEYDQLVDETIRLSENLLSPGYPQDWAEDVIKVGLLYDGRLSWRKLYEFANMDDKKEVLPTRFNYLITLKKNESIQEIDGFCGISNTNFPQTSTTTTTYFDLAYYSGGENELESWANSNNATLYTTLFTLFEESPQYGLIIFEDANFTNQLNDTFTPQVLREELRELATYGPRIVLLGGLGETVFGVSTNTSSGETTIDAHEEPFFFFNESDDINFTTTYELNFSSANEGTIGNLGGAKRIQTISEGAATWQFEDSRVYYFSSATGDYTTEQLKDVLEQGLGRLRIKSTVDCEINQTQIDSPDIVSVERIVANRGELLTLTLTLWRNS